MKKKCLQMAVVPVLAFGLSALLIMPASAGTTNWTGNGDGVNWTDGNNWDDDTSGEDIVIKDATVFLDEDDSIDKLKMYSTTLTIDGSVSGDADLKNKGDLELRSGDNTLNLISASFKMTGGGDDIKQEYSSGVFTLDMVDSAFETDEVKATKKDNTEFNLIMLNSTFKANDDFKSDDKDASVTFDITGSTITVDGEFELANEGSISFTSDNSTVNAERFQFRGDDTMVASFSNGSQVNVSRRLDLADEGGGSLTLNISGGSAIDVVRDGDDGRIRVGSSSSSIVINISDTSRLTTDRELQLKDDGSSQINLSGSALLGAENFSADSGVTAGTDWIDFRDSATMVVGDLSEEGDIVEMITENIFTASAGGMVSYNLSDNPGDITVFAVSEDSLLGDLPDINIGSNGKTPLHLLLTEVDWSSVLIGDPTLSGTSSPLKIKQAGDDQTVIHVSTQQLVADGSIDAASTSLRVTGFLENGTYFTASSSFNLPSLMALSAAAAAVPEPSSLILLGLGSMGLLFRRKR